MVSCLIFSCSCVLSLKPPRDLPFSPYTIITCRSVKGWYLIPVDAKGNDVLRVQRQPPQQPMPPTIPLPLQPQFLQQPPQHLLHDSLDSERQKEATCEKALEQRNPMPDTSARSAAATSLEPATSQAVVGSRVLLQGLKHAQRFNGKYGIVVATVQKDGEDRLSISLEHDGSLLSVKRCNAEVAAANVSEAATGAGDKQKPRAEALVIMKPNHTPPPCTSPSHLLPPSQARSPRAWRTRRCRSTLRG